ncbi:hypothetical protein QFC20_003561 [Naganishia adeliensis]|uniref:Uncharacterized protein n=1 Tax=Naganishia adeliensis TaxID=92952 RepID=A0ACC2W9U3_9TREE|nr:hypothetical protein QFC20_003561 [Naganishia adeliensis]
MALTLNLTIDDFDPLIAYSNPVQWTTPNPQDHPSWFNQSQQETGSIWHQATYHQTSIPGAEARFNFTGDTLDIYGFSNTSYQVIIDPSFPEPYTANITTNVAFASSADSQSRAALFSTTSLSSNAQLLYAPHEVLIRNLGTGVLGLDYVVVGGIPVGAEGATLTNTTVDDNNSTLKYTGSWTTNNVTDFWGGSSAYTNTPGDSVSLAFAGSAVYVYGDQVNDHGYYTVFINDTQIANLTGRSGCAGSDGEKSCEKLGAPSFLRWGFAGRSTRSADSQRRNIGESDVLWITYTTPSNYSTEVAATDLDCPFVNCTATASSPSGSASPSGTSTRSPATSAASGVASASASPTSGGERLMRGWIGGMVAMAVVAVGLWTSL